MSKNSKTTAEYLIINTFGSSKVAYVAQKILKHFSLTWGDNYIQC
jgi:hypothetical protein